jgi:hypothetical protein
VKPYEDGQEIRIFQCPACSASDNLTVFFDYHASVKKAS